MSLSAPPLPNSLPTPPLRAGILGRGGPDVASEEEEGEDCGKDVLAGELVGVVQRPHHPRQLLSLARPPLQRRQGTAIYYLLG